MHLYIICIVSLLSGLATATPQDNQPASCKNPVVTVTSVVDQTLTLTSTTTIGPTATTIVLPTTVTSNLIETVNPCPTSPKAANTKRDDLPEPTLLPYNRFRAPHLPTQPPYLPDCPNSSPTTTTLTTTATHVEEKTLTTTITTTPHPSTLYNPTITITKTSTFSPPPCPTLPATDAQSGYTTNYILYSSTCGKVLSYANPANTNPPVVLEISGNKAISACQAASQCANAARNQGAGYLSFDVHWMEASKGWECVMFFGRNWEGEYWQGEEGVAEGYGYSV